MLVCMSVCKKKDCLKTKIEKKDDGTGFSDDKRVK